MFSGRRPERSSWPIPSCRATTANAYGEIAFESAGYVHQYRGDFWIAGNDNNLNSVIVTNTVLDGRVSPENSECSRIALGFGNGYNGRQKNFLTCEQALELIKGMDAVTLGQPKIVYLVGWQYNGHDSKYPAFFEANPAVKRPQDATAFDSLRWLMAEARKYHTAVSLHINMFDAYTDSPLFEEYRRADVLARDKEGHLLTGD